MCSESNLIFGQFLLFGPAVQWLADQAGRADARVSGNVPATSGFSFAIPLSEVAPGLLVIQIPIQAVCEAML